ncbi:hypothetical protein CspeluHIS016_0405220 [Cutaneotrichosporon spelunceum]|uniref:Uncharacterized protein n=1 Tax=Cutaneotrichosporon spelunceum TaxID=1672016 RepID=A0AAD3TVI6_9TREE|nr:hypothetical protein CspeluHIS016_0405220 [Cutaneotrichosporon spelunceum]
MAHGRRGRSGAHRRQVGMSPDKIDAIQASLSAEAKPNASPVPTPIKEKDTPKPVAPTPPAAQSTPQAPPTPAAPATTPKAATPPPASSAPQAPAATQPAPQATAPQGIRTVTASRGDASGTAAAPAASESTSSGISGGAIAGIVIGLIAGIIVIGGVAGWLYRKYKERNYDNNAAAWTKMSDDNNGVTPYRNDPKTNASDEEFYSGLPPAGAMHTQGFQPPPQPAYYADNGMRPDSMAGMESNLAGYGAGVRSGPYSDPAPVAVAYDANGRPYTPTQQNGQWGYDHHQQEQYAPSPFDDANRMSPPGSLDSSNSPQHQQNFGGPRQLVGPGQNFAGAAPVPAPVPLGRPQPPQSYDDIAAAEMYADDRYADDHMAAPPHFGHFTQQQQHGNFSPESFATAEAHNFGNGTAHDQRAISPLSPMPTSIIHPPQPLPTMQPMSPLMSPVAIHNDDESIRMYDEVARAAGVPNPSVAPPLSPDSHQQQQNFLPLVMPYQHGVPLSPLTEVPTPAPSAVALMPDGPVSAETSVAQRVMVPTASPSIVSAAPVPRPLPAIPQQQTAPSPAPASPPAPATSGAPIQAHARTDSLDDAYGGI